MLYYLFRYEKSYENIWGTFLSWTSISLVTPMVRLYFRIFLNGLAKKKGGVAI